MALQNLRLATVAHVAQRTENTSLHLPQKSFVFAFSKAQLVKRLPNATQPTQRPPAEGRKPAGRSQKGKGKTRLARPAVAQPDPVAVVTYDSSSASSEDDSEIPLDVDPFEQSVILDGPARDLEQRQISFTPGQLAAIQQTVQQSVAEALHNQRSQAVSDTAQSFHSFPSSSSGPQQRRPGTATPLGFQRALEKSTEEKILRGEYIDFALLLPDSLSQPQVPELQFRFDDSGPAPSSRMTMVRKRKPIIDNFHKWLDAYTTYMLVLVTAYPRRSLELLKYQQTISCAATKFKGLSWLTYDEQFRRRAANDLTINYHSPSDCPSADPSRQLSRNGPVCFRFNRAPGCSSSSC